MTNTPEILLKPCPFCGSDRITTLNIRDGMQATCKDCHATGKPVFHGPKGRDATGPDARAAWNTRAALSPEPAQDVTRPERVQAAFEVFEGKEDCGPNAAALFEYIKQLEAERDVARSVVKDNLSAIEEAQETIESLHSRAEKAEAERDSLKVSYNNAFLTNADLYRDMRKAEVRATQAEASLADMQREPTDADMKIISDLVESYDYLGTGSCSKSADKERIESIAAMKRLQSALTACQKREAELLEQNDWLKDRLAFLQLPANQHDRREEWFTELGLPALNKEGA